MIEPKFLGGVGGVDVWGLASLVLADALRRIPLERWYGVELPTRADAVTTPAATVPIAETTSARAHAIF
jgi:hypothetical protein